MPTTKEMKLSLSQDKVTKGAVRFSDGESHSIYLRKGEVNKLGDAARIEVTIKPA